MSSDDVPGQKRQRQEPDLYITSFGENLMKRRNTAIARRVSPRLNLPAAPTLSCNTSYSHHHAPTIFTGSLDSDVSLVLQTNVFLSPCTSSSDSTAHHLRNNHISSNFDRGSQPGLSFTEVSMIPPYLNDLEMSDSFNHSTGSYRHESSANVAVAGRIPTPICSTFSSVSGTENISIRGKRYPSPISEGEVSPSTIVAGFSDMQMEVETTSPLGNRSEKSQNKINHIYKRDSRELNTTDENSKKTKKSFTMGYRADCEKCRMKVPGHFSHIISS